MHVNLVGGSIRVMGLCHSRIFAGNPRHPYNVGLILTIKILLPTCIYIYDISYRIIYAFDKDPLRYETLLKMIEVSSASCIVSMNQDFLEVCI